LEIHLSFEFCHLTLSIPRQGVIDHALRQEKKKSEDGEAQEKKKDEKRSPQEKIADSV